MKRVSLLAAGMLVAGLAQGQSEAKQESYQPGIELPPGPGRELVATACTRCHDLKGLPAYKGYWNRSRWQSMVESMVRNGAKLDDLQMALVTDYLTRHYGPRNEGDE